MRFRKIGNSFSSIIQQLEKRAFKSQGSLFMWLNWVHSVDTTGWFRKWFGSMKFSFS